jgi:hypothetical protein
MTVQVTQPSGKTKAAQGFQIQDSLHQMMMTLLPGKFQLLLGRAIHDRMGIRRAHLQCLT